MYLAVAGILVMLGIRAAPAQDLRERPLPFSAWLDLRPTTTEAAPQAVPGWIESMEFTGPEDLGVGPRADDGPRSIHRIRLHAPPGADALLIRLYFDDLPGSGPIVTAWDELGRRLWSSRRLGDGLALANAKSVSVPAVGLDYVEIEVPGDGTLLRSAYLNWMAREQVLNPIDENARRAVVEPFRPAPAPAQAMQGDDTFLHGVVRAALSTETHWLNRPQGEPLAFEFMLEKSPLVALVSFEVLGLDAEVLPELFVNGRSMGTVAVVLPDLADPGYRGELRENNPTMVFRYSGWLHAQKLIPTLLLGTGGNRIELRLPATAAAAAVRTVEIQLKYPWDKFDYESAPTR
ncbi:hypothetical protein AYO41_02770 [Verrucomicrobia bacterium SCGC AG-212-E04]|nr:hypothetical protein AYO41_02770 [Verrucomicrobia bacterium SCGC AG-212-E04]